MFNKELKACLLNVLIVIFCSWVVWKIVRWLLVTVEGLEGSSSGAPTKESLRADISALLAFLDDEGVQSATKERLGLASLLKEKKKQLDALLSQDGDDNKSGGGDMKQYMANLGWDYFKEKVDCDSGIDYGLVDKNLSLERVEIYALIKIWVL